MKELSENQMAEVAGGNCPDIAAVGAVTFASLGVGIALALGPVGWGAALIYGAAAVTTTALCS